MISIISILVAIAIVSALLALVIDPLKLRRAHRARSLELATAHQEQLDNERVLSALINISDRPVRELEAASKLTRGRVSAALARLHGDGLVGAYTAPAMFGEPRSRRFYLRASGRKELESAIARER